VPSCPAAIRTLAPISWAEPRTGRLADPVNGRSDGDAVGAAVKLDVAVAEDEAEDPADGGVVGVELGGDPQETARRLTTIDAATREGEVSIRSSPDGV
jgi:hypothetical protein